MHYEDLFPSLPDEARCWVYVAGAPLSAAQEDTLRTRLDGFFQEWVSHGRAVSGAASIIDGRLLLVAGHVDGGISGCGIDSLTATIRSASTDLGITWIDSLNIVYRAADATIDVTTRTAFREQVSTGTVTLETPVFDLSVTTLGAVRAGQFEKPARDSWHARAFRIPHAA